MNSIYQPAITVKVYKDDVEVKFTGNRVTAGKVGCSGRGCIKLFSHSSAKRMKLFLKENQDIINVMVRLSYPDDFPCDGRIVKRHIDSFTKRLRRRGIRWFWWLEFQERGAPHIHLYIDKPIPKDDLSKMWFEVVGSEDLKHLVSGTRIEKVRDRKKGIGYAMSYAKKNGQKIVPPGFENVGRWWGSSEKCKPSGELKLKFKSEKDRMKWLRTFRKWRQAKLKVWGSESGRKYQIKPKNQGFFAWDSRQAWERFINSKIDQDRGILTQCQTQRENIIKKVSYKVKAFSAKVKLQGLASSTLKTDL